MNRKPYPTAFSILDWLSEIFNDTKHRAVSLRQLTLCRFVCVLAGYWLYLTVYFTSVPSNALAGQAVVEIICSVLIGTLNYTQVNRPLLMYQTLILLGLALSSEHLCVFGLRSAVYTKKFFCLHPFLYLSMSWAWWDWSLMWLTNHHLSVLWHCCLGHLTRNIVSEMTCNVSNETLNPTTPTHAVAYVSGVPIYVWSCFMSTHGSTVIRCLAGAVVFNIRVCLCLAAYGSWWRLLLWLTLGCFLLEGWNACCLIFKKTTTSLWDYSCFFPSMSVAMYVMCEIAWLPVAVFFIVELYIPTVCTVAFSWLLLFIGCYEGHPACRKYCSSSLWRFLWRPFGGRWLI